MVQSEGCALESSLSTTVVCVELARFVSSTVDSILACGSQFTGYGPRLVGVDVDQSLLSRRGLNIPVGRVCIRMLLPKLLS